MEIKTKYNIEDEVFALLGGKIVKFKIGAATVAKDGIVSYIEDVPSGQRPMVILEKFADTDFNRLKETIKSSHRKNTEEACDELDKLKEEDIDKEEEKI